MKNFKTFAQITFMVLLLIGVFGSFLELRQLNNNFTKLGLYNTTAVQTGLKHNKSGNNMTNTFAVQQVNIVNPTIAEEYRNESGNAVQVDAIPVVIVGDRR